MRLTLINQFYTPDISPTAHLCASLAEHRAMLGDEVTVIAGRGGYVAPVGNGQDGIVNVIRVWTSQLGSGSRLSRFLDWVTFYVGAFWQAMRLPPQDVIVCLTTPPYIALAGVIQKMLHPETKLVLWNMDCYPEILERTGMIREGGWVGRICRAIHRAVFRQLDCVVALDPAMLHLLQHYAPENRPLPCAIIPNWERADLFSVQDAGTPWALPDEQSRHGKFVVLYLGNAGYGHEFATLLEAAEQLRDDPIQFLFVGGGAMRQWIEREARRRGLKNVTWLDYVPKEKTPAVMQRADCALITLENYAAGVMSPSKLHSNLAMGLPVLYIGPEGTNVDQAVSRFGCGIAVRPGDSQAAIQFIRELIHDPQRKVELRERARAAFSNAYSDRSVLPRFDRLFAHLLQPPGLHAKG